MSEWRLFPPGQPPEWTTPGWYDGREAAPHLEQEGHRQRLWLTADMLDEAVRLGGTDLVDLGAGDGGLLSVFADRHPGPCWGYDLQQTNVAAAAARGADVEYLDVVNEWPESREDIPSIVVATELLEHLVDPHRLLRRIREPEREAWLSCRPDFLVVSSPYTETDESHYEFHTWAWDLAGYRALLEDNGWRVLRQETAWISQVLLAVPDTEREEMTW